MSRLRRRLSSRALGAAAGLVADRFLGEPPIPDRWHPVAMLGSAAGLLERLVYADARRNGLLYAGVGAGASLAAGGLVHSPALATYVTTSGRALHDAAGAVATALEHDDLAGARGLLPNLVGRDPAGLGGDEIARAVVESVAENTTDAIVAPALWAVAGGAPAAFLHRAADTLDSMVGYRDSRYRRFGTAAARLDDAMAWLPARSTALLVAIVRPRRARVVVDVVRSDAAAHPSPNAGVAEAAFAAALDLRMGGANRYGETLEVRPDIGRGRPPRAADIAAAVKLSRDATLALAGLLATLGAATWTSDRAITDRPRSPRSAGRRGR